MLFAEFPKATTMFRNNLQSYIMTNTSWSRTVYILLKIVPLGDSGQHSNHFVSANCDPV
jgi:hypothetical protein